MDSYFTLIVGIVVVVVIAMALAAFNNRAEEPRQREQNRQQQKVKKTEKKQKKTSDGSQQKSKKKVNPVTFNWDGKREDEDASMVELLKGTGEFLAKEAKAEVVKKARTAVSTVGQAVEKVKGGKEAADDSGYEYVLMKRKKVDEKPAKKKKAAAAAVTPVEGEAQVAVPEVNEGKGKKKGFYKKGVFASIRDAASAEAAAKQQEDEEKASSRRGKNKDGSAATEEPAQDEKKDKPAKAKKPEGSRPEDEVTENQAVGPRQQRPKREPREPREPREAPPPPPRPVGGHFETASLDDMLSAISTHYGPKPKQNFAKLPPPVLFKLMRYLSVRDIVALSRVNHFLSKTSRDDRMWRNFCEKDFAMKFSNKNPTKQKKFKNIYRDEYLKNKNKA